MGRKTEGESEGRNTRGRKWEGRREKERVCREEEIGRGKDKMKRKGSGEEK